MTTVALSVVRAAWSSRVLMSGAAAAISAVALGAAVQPASAQQFNQVIVFGDSNVDSGFYRQLSNPGGSATYNSLWPAAVAAGAGAPTSRPGLMNSEVLAGFLGLTASPSNTPGGTNYATSGAKNVTVNTSQTGGFQAAIPTVTQISNYLAAVNNVANSQALYLIHSGDNDAKYAAGETGTGPYPQDPNAYMTQAADQLATAIQSLHNAGAQSIIVSGLAYDFPKSDPTLTGLKLLYTNELWSKLASLGVPFIKSDVNSVYHAIFANPSLYGFSTVSNTSPACTQPSGVTTAWALLCSSNPSAPSTWVSATAPQTNLFADDQHFATAGQKLVANYLYHLVVPLADSHDFDSNGKSDVLWMDTSGNVALWLMNGAQVAQAASLGSVGTAAGWSAVGQRDFLGDTNADILWRDTAGDLAIWFMNGAAVSSVASLGNVAPNWGVYGTGDLNGDGRGDILWWDSSSGTVAVWYMNGSQVASTASFGTVSPSSWTLIGDGGSPSGAGVVWRDTNFDYVVWLIKGGQVVNTCSFGQVPSNWIFSAIGDFNGDGNVDIIWRDTNTGTVAIWLTTGNCAVGSVASFGSPGGTWKIAQTGDYNGDGRSDILWIDGSGNVAAWFMNGGAVSSVASYGSVGPSWSVQALHAE